MVGRMWHKAGYLIILLAGVVLLSWAGLRWASIGFAMGLRYTRNLSDSQLEGQGLLVVVAVGIALVGYSVFELWKGSR